MYGREKFLATSFIQIYINYEFVFISSFRGRKKANGLVEQYEFQICNKNFFFYYLALNLKERNICR